MKSSTSKKAPTSQQSILNFFNNACNSQGTSSKKRNHQEMLEGQVPEVKTATELVKEMKVKFKF
jgi:hypothetical protein